MTVTNLVKHFAVRGGPIRIRAAATLRAVDGVSFQMAEGETLGLVGESGCGKTTLGRLILRLLPATSGSVLFDGRSILDCKRRELKAMRRQMQIVFQDPYASLNPRLTVGDIVGEGLLIHGIGGKQRDLIVREMIERVGLTQHHLERYPHELSGGQRQRIGIARALVLQPRLVVCDEPVSALDVSIQAQVLNLLLDLQDELRLTYLVIGHNLAVIRHVATRIGVMYLGKLIEIAYSDDLYSRPRHPYTVALLSAVPIQDPTVRGTRVILRGDLPSPVNPPSGCRFHTRCPIAQDVCSVQEPPLRQVGMGHLSACHFAERVTVPAVASVGRPTAD